MSGKMKKWIKENRRSKEVIEWLSNNPPPEEWTGTRMEWAYTEMPQGFIGKILTKIFG